MLRIMLGTVTANNGQRVGIKSSDGFGDFEAPEAFVIAPGGAGKVQAWMPPSEGDQVLCLIDDERPDLVYVLGALWTNDQAPAVTAPDQILLQAPGGITLADSEGAQAIPRDDHVQAELDKIKTMLDDVKAVFNAHVHVTPGGPAEATKTLITAAYTKGATATDLIKGV